MITFSPSRHSRTATPLRLLLLAALLTAITAACGNRGPLYLPGEAPPPDVATGADPDSGEAAPGAEEAREEAQEDAFGHEGDEED